MALIKVFQQSLCSLASMPSEKVEETLTELGIPIEGTENGWLSLEIMPNRPDWLSVEGIARSCHSYLTGKPKKYLSEKSNISWHVHPSVKSLRPYVGSALIKGVPMTQEIFDSLIQLQEKLHDTLGRKRRKMAIGIHDISHITDPFTYRAVGRDEVSFIPLGESEKMTCGQILQKHEKGIKYAHLVGEKCPIIQDIHGNVLSFPPIINGELTKLTINSKNLLLDCTGTHEKTVQSAISIICAALTDRGAKIYSVKIDGKHYPIFEQTKNPIPLKEANEIIGVKLSDRQVEHHLRRLGHECDKTNVYSPAFRPDIMHAVDLVEDIAISIGYNNIVPLLPDFPSTAKSLDNTEPLHEAALGLGYFEIMGWILTNQKILQKSGVSPSDCQRVKNPLTEEFTTLRPLLYPNMLDIFSRSKSETYPQYLYEIGPVIRKNSDNQFSQFEHIAFSATHPKASFSQTYSHLKGFLSALGLTCELDEKEISGFISGRCAHVKINGEDVGIIGEIHPSVLESFGLEQPAALFELDIKLLEKK